MSLRDDRPEKPDIGNYFGSTGEKQRWENSLDLTSEDTHFFSRSKASQQACLEKFIKESFKFGKTIIKP